MIELRRRQYPDPWGRSSHGEEPACERSTIDDVRQFHARHYRPNGTILAVAGNFDWQRLCDRRRAAVRRLAAERRRPSRAAANGQPPANHIPFESNQTHIGIAYPTIPYKHPDYFQAWAAVGVLSSGSSSRLFTEVRERRGLCYTVYASLHTQRDRASVFCYAGTTAERAQETLDVTVGELHAAGRGHRAERARPAQGPHQELADHAAGIDVRPQRRDRPRLVSPWAGRGRSTKSAGWSTSCRPRASTPFWTKNPPRDLPVVTLGPEPLEVPRWNFVSSSRSGPTAWRFVAEATTRRIRRASGFFVRTGARDETDDVAGVSHFLEHMCFKGTPRRSADDVNREFDEMGAHYNAFTSEENTVYYAAVLPEYQEASVDLLADILRPSLRRDDFDTEKKVILEEIQMYEDQPPFGMDDRIKELHFGRHPLGRSVLGTSDERRGPDGRADARTISRRATARATCSSRRRARSTSTRWSSRWPTRCGDWKPQAARREMPRAASQAQFEVVHRPTATQQYVLQLADAPAARRRRPLRRQAAGHDRRRRLGQPPLLGTDRSRPGRKRQPRATTSTWAPACFTPGWQQLARGRRRPDNGGLGNLRPRASRRVRIAHRASACDRPLCK